MSGLHPYPHWSAQVTEGEVGDGMDAYWHATANEEFDKTGWSWEGQTERYAGPSHTYPWIVGGVAQYVDDDSPYSLHAPRRGAP